MKKEIRVVSTRKVENVPAVGLASATYEGSAPFSGLFQVFDPDMTMYKNPETGRTRVPVICYFGARDGEDDCIVLEVDDVIIHLFDHNPDDVIDRIDWAV